MTTMRSIALAAMPLCLLFHACADAPEEVGMEEQAATAPALRIMPLGDSITFGVGSSTGSSYRLALWNLLAGQSLDFVGTCRSRSTLTPSLPLRVPFGPPPFLRYFSGIGDFAVSCCQ